ncbi:MAG: hypothetical protein KAX49_04015 [Halanaerobiales bacterium]|nr:hypothetical protein [Halanaerobiales bacterium]
MPKNRFSAQQKVDIVLCVKNSEVSSKELCKEVGIQPKSYYWNIFIKTESKGF